MTLQQQTFAGNRRGAPPPKEHRRAGEVAGGATAECAAVFCCLPCAVMELVVLAAYKVPAGLVKRAMGKRNRRRVQKKKRRGDVLLRQKQAQVQQSRQNGVVAEGKKVGPTLLEEHLAKDAPKNSESVELEEEMWAQFNGTGFWRSTSQRLNQLPQRTQQLPQPATENRWGNGSPVTGITGADGIQVHVLESHSRKKNLNV